MSRVERVKEKVYCGTRDLPDDYDRYGSRYECLRKGVGVGMYKEREERKRGEDEARGERRGRGRVTREREIKDELNDIFRELAELLSRR